jgi:hypothetical protein
LQSKPITFACNHGNTCHMSSYRTFAHTEGVATCHEVAVVTFFITKNTQGPVHFVNGKKKRKDRCRQSREHMPHVIISHLCPHRRCRNMS